MIGKELEAAIGEAPEHIAGLRKLAVAFAIGGRLDSSTVGPEELLAQIEATRSELERAGKVKKRKGSLTVQPEHLPEAFNDVSRFVPLAEIATIEKGKTGIKQAIAGEFPLVVTAVARETCDHFDFDAAAAIIPLVSSTGHGNASINRLHYQEGKFALGTILAAVVPHDPDAISARFLFEYLSAFKDELLVSRMTGTANVTLTIGRIGEVPVPLLSAEAQFKVDELMALCDRLEEARKTREEVRDKLTAASLARLTAPETTSEDFPTHAAFALEALPALTTRPDQIKTLRQTILNLAVRGKLVEQDPADELPSKSLHAINAAREAMVKAKEIRREKPLVPIQPDDIPFSIPTTWKWVRIGDLALFTQYGTSAKAAMSDTGVPVLTMGNIQDGRVVRKNEKRIPEASDELPSLFLRDLDLLYNRTNSAELVGKTGIFTGNDDNLTFASYLIRVRLHVEATSPHFVNLAMNAPDFRETQIVPHIKKQTGQANVSGSALKNMLIPLPPLAEQHRIVAKVDALMALCDRLEAALTTADTTRTRLLEALLHEALEPADKVLEVAE